MPSMGGVYREGGGAILRITLYASYQVPPSHLLATFVVTCKARIYLPSLLHACTHTFTTSSYTSNYLECILPGCYLINKRATPLQRYQFGVRQILATEVRLCHHHLPIGPPASASSIASDQHQKNFTSSLTYYRKSLVKSRPKSNYLSLYILYTENKNDFSYYAARRHANAIILSRFPPAPTHSLFPPPPLSFYC
jgi:hypothetical protein